MAGMLATHNAARRDAGVPALQWSDALTTSAPGAVCGHYTQVVWRSTTQLGCAKAQCGRSEVWVCQYTPPGNYVGQRPF